jgi:hypothetical protein
LRPALLGPEGVSLGAVVELVLLEVVETIPELELLVLELETVAELEMLVLEPTEFEVDRT